MFQSVSKSNISGHRVIDISLFFKELVKAASHESLFECGLNTMELTCETSLGLHSKFLLTCLLCKTQFTISNSNMNLNKMAVEGIVAAGCGKAQLNQLLAALELPVLSQHTYENMQDIIFDEWEVTAWEEMKKAGQREKEAAIKEGRLTNDGIPIIDVILDGCWSKRSYRTNYAAPSGAACIIGRRFGQVLYMAVKNKYCCICSRAEHRNEIVRQHECYKNYTGPSTAMESAIIAEGFKKSIEMHGVIYGRFIADGDSSTYAKIINTRPYPFLTVEKIGCRNHILRNLCNKLQSLKSDTKFIISERKLLTNVKILSARRYIINSIKYHGNQKEEKHDKIKKLHADILMCMHHAFGCHDSCNKNICTEKNTPEFQMIYNTNLWQKISHCVNCTATQARSLIENVDSNIVESFNGVVAKLVGGKRVNYSRKRSYQARCTGAVVAFNSGRLLTTVHKTVGHKSHDAIANFEDTVDKTRRYNRSLKRKRNRKFITQIADSHYGGNVAHPDMDLQTYELAKASFLKNLVKTERERREIERRTILQSESGEWLELRRNLLTASNFGKIVKRRKSNSCVNIVKNMLYRPNIDHVASISHGKKNEKPALAQLSRLLNLEIKDCGLFIDEKYPFLGATPDGITDDMVIEIKCPIAPFKIGIDAAIKEGKMHFWRMNKKTGQMFINEKSDWYFQVQGQMHICRKEKCLLAVWYGENKIKTEIITKDDRFWKEKMEPNLLTFYYDCLLPELVDPRYTRNQPIRDPDYVLTKKSNLEMNKENLSVCTNNIQVRNTAEGKNQLEKIMDEDESDESGVSDFRNI